MKETAYLFQASLLCLWWVGLTVSPVFFAAFQFEGISGVSFWSFFAADIIFLVILSIIRTYFINVLIEFMILGAFGYATVYCWNASLLTSSGYLSSGVMTLGFAYNVFLCFSSSLFRNSSSGLALNSVKTVIQIICIWILALAVVPYFLLEAFDANEIPSLGMKFVFAIILFLFASLLGLTSAYFMVRDGDGTPLPLDQTNKLVVCGPYRFVRNPMAIAGISQGIAVAVAFNSTPIFVYSILGALVWHLVVKPVEERDMFERFGDEFAEYSKRVRCWIPRMK